MGAAPNASPERGFTVIKITVLTGRAVVSPEDIERASRAAAQFFLEAEVDPAVAWKDFTAQMAVLAKDVPPNKMGDKEKLTGIAAIWRAAEKAANKALTEGWMRPDGASCWLRL